ncbi:triphosphoribosyl-dephospho-CoA synthase CitG [Vibrio harveyi]|uniref:triphosphoribosyl-dephospho-CoA synthase CitG n=1 Tax=Vibrio harveyi TaxID=669 RepID=UPI004069024C
MTNVALKLLLDQNIERVPSVAHRSAVKVNLFSLVSELAYHAMLVEVHLSPKPGLVDLISNGAHSDMNVPLFEASASAIRPFLNGFLNAGLAHATHSAETLLDVLRPIGIQAERAMFAATGGVNTHKGMIFGLGLVCGAIGWLKGKGIAVDSLHISQVIKRSCALMVFQELKNTDSKKETHGERLYREFGLTGARGEAASGYQTIMTYSLPAYQQALYEGASAEQALWQVLLTLMVHNQDTNVVSRGGMHGLRYVQNIASKLIDSGGWHNPNLEEQLLDFDRQLIEKNLSPGGSADLLALTWLLAEIDDLTRHIIANHDE